MAQNLVPPWVRGVSWIALIVALVFISLGALYSKLEWACAGFALVVYAVVQLTGWKLTGRTFPAPGERTWG